MGWRLVFDGDLAGLTYGLIGDLVGLVFRFGQILHGLGWRIAGFVFLSGWAGDFVGWRFDCTDGPSWTMLLGWRCGWVRRLDWVGDLETLAGLEICLGGRFAWVGHLDG